MHYAAPQKANQGCFDDVCNQRRECCTLLPLVVAPCRRHLPHGCQNLKIAVAESKADCRPASYNGICAQLLWLRPYFTLMGMP
jgi:hypothetical protein